MEPTAWYEPFVRQFPDRVLRSLMGTGALFVQFLDVAEPGWAARLEPESLVQIERSFIDEAYRERTGDLACMGRVLLHGVSVAVLLHFDHQSSPDPWMPQRILHAIATTWEVERRRLEAATEGPGLTPIVPSLLYTGHAPWVDPFDLDGLVRVPGLASFTPRGRILYLDLARTHPGRLESSRHPIAWTFRLLQEERSGLAAFARLLEWAAGRLNRLPDSRIEEWRAIVRFLFALVLHRRPEDEHPRLFETIRTRLKPRRRTEVDDMEKTLGRTLPERKFQEGREEGLEEGREEGREQGREQGLQEGIDVGRLRAKRETLLRLAAAKFGRLPPESTAAIDSCEDESRLDGWLDRLLVATTPAELIR